MRPILFWRHRSEQENFDDGGGEVIGAVLKACGRCVGARAVSDGVKAFTGM